MVRICLQYAPPGIRVAGEIDYRAEEPLALALAEAALPRKVILQCQPPIADTRNLFGAGHVPSVVMVTIDDG
jgi:hypothetical protein